MNKQHPIQEDFLAEGFHQLDDNLIELKAPRLTEPTEFAAKSDNQKYLHYRKIAATMNHAAKLIQDERNKLVKLMEKKEKQLINMSQQVQASNEMVQREVARMNEQKQGFHAEVARLNERIRELENGS